MPELDIRGVSIHYELLGQGEPVAFLNGVLMTTQSWVLQTSVLRDRYRCLLHDFRGQLASGKPESAWTLEDHCEDFRELLDRLEIPSCHVIGTSYGGEVGMIFAAAHPERVRSLSLVSCTSEVDRELDRAVGVWAEAALGDPKALYRTTLPFNFSPRFLAANPKLVEQGEERLNSCPPEFFPALARLIDAFRQLDVTADLHRIACPTLVLVGEKDALKPPRCSRLIAEKIEGSEFLVIPEGGHAVIIEKPQEVATALLGFLEKQRGYSVLKSSGEPSLAE